VCGKLKLWQITEKGGEIGIFLCLGSALVPRSFPAHSSHIITFYHDAKENKSLLAVYTFNELKVNKMKDVLSPCSPTLAVMVLLINYHTY